MRILAAIDQPEVAGAILDCLGLSSRAPHPRPRSRPISNSASRSPGPATPGKPAAAAPATATAPGVDLPRVSPGGEAAPRTARPLDFPAIRTPPLEAPPPPCGETHPVRSGFVGILRNSVYRNQETPLISPTRTSVSPAAPDACADDPAPLPFSIDMSRTTLWTATVLISVTLSVIIAEAMLRLERPNPLDQLDFRLQRTHHARIRSSTGMESQTRKLHHSPMGPIGNGDSMRFRCTRAAPHESGRNAARQRDGHRGGSFAQGWGISDEETLAWKLQERFPSLNVMNYGTGGYGTYQSLLVLENELPLLKSPVIVLYGFILHHAARNLAPVSWLKVLSKLSRRGIVHMPHATLDEDGALVRHPPAGYLRLPLRESSATIAFVEEVYMRTRIRTLKEQKARKVLERILLEMAAASERYGARFLVVNFQPVRQPTKLLFKFLEVNHIEYVDCGFPFEGMTVPGEAHPNGDMNTLLGSTASWMHSGNQRSQRTR